MGNKTTDISHELESWQIEDATRLRAIFERHKSEARASGARFTQAMFAERTGIASPNMVWQYLSAHRPLNIQAAAEFARGLGIAVRDFSPTLASQIEQVAEVQRGAAADEVKKPRRRLQWVDDWESDLLSNCRATNDQGRATVMESSELVPKVLFDELANHKSKNSGG